MKQKIITILTKIEEVSLYGILFFLPISKTAIEIFVSFLIPAFFARNLLGQSGNLYKKIKVSHYLIIFMFFSTGVF